MTYNTILQILLVIIVVDYLLDRWLSYLNDKSSRAPVPKALEGIYDNDRYQESQRYHHERGRFGVITATSSFLLTFCAIYFGWFGWLDAVIRSFSPFDMLSTLIFFGILFLLSDILSTPFSIYSTFVIEEKFGFNKTTVKTFLFDKVKSWLLTILVGGLLLVAFLYMIMVMGSDFWLYFWGVITLLILFLNVFYTSWILPLFNKLTPLEEGELKSAITRFSKQVNFPLSNVFVMDGSKRSNKGNAFFSGLGKRKKVVFFDTLIAKHSIEELTAVFAHEVGHYKKKHIILGTILGVLQVGVMLYLLSKMIFNADVSYALGGEVSVIHLNVLAFVILYTPLSRLLGVFMNWMSRKNEFEADAYAADQYAAAPLISGLKKMSSDHLSILTPHPAYVFVHFSHPPLYERVKAMSLSI